MFNKLVNMCIRRNRNIFIHLNSNKITCVSCLENSGNKRLLSTRNEYNLIPNYHKMGSTEERQDYQSCFAYLINDLRKPYEELPEAQKHYIMLLQNYAPYVNYSTGFTVIRAYKAIESIHNLTPENIRLANILGLCVDMVLCSYMITDDIMDSSETRFGFPCWYRNADIGMRAIIDIYLLENSPFVLLKSHFSNHNCYAPLMELFRKVNFKAATGQTQDVMATVNGKPQFDFFTMNVYQTTAKNKSGYPFFVLPTFSALHLAGKNKEELYKDLKNILLKLGEYFQVQNDISDCYGNPKITGKKGNDISQGRNTWLIVKALENATTAQQDIIKKHYGKPNSESKEKIKAMYNSMYILEQFLQYQEETYNILCKDVLRLPSESIRNYLLNVVETVLVRDNV